MDRRGFLATLTTILAAGCNTTDRSTTSTSVTAQATVTSTTTTPEPTRTSTTTTEEPTTTTTEEPTTTTQRPGAENDIRQAEELLQAAITQYHEAGGKNGSILEVNATASNFPSSSIVFKARNAASEIREAKNSDPRDDQLPIIQADGALKNYLINAAILQRELIAAHDALFQQQDAIYNDLNTEPERREEVQSHRATGEDRLENINEIELTHLDRFQHITPDLVSQKHTQFNAEHPQIGAFTSIHRDLQTGLKLVDESWGDFTFSNEFTKAYGGFREAEGVFQSIEGELNRDWTLSLRQQANRLAEVVGVLREAMNPLKDAMLQVADQNDDTAAVLIIEAQDTLNMNETVREDIAVVEPILEFGH